MKLGLAHTRLRKELKEYEKLQEKDRIRLILPEKENLFLWHAILRGPPDTPYEGGIFTVNIKVPDNYPISPPKCVFMTKIFHPNIDINSGEICFELLKDKWTPQWSLESVCIAIFNLLSNPNADSPLNCDAGNLIRHHDYIGYRTMAKMYTVEYATDFKMKPKEHKFKNKKIEK